MTTMFDIPTALVDARIYRQTTFDRETFDALQDAKRALNAHHRVSLTNAEVLRVLILSHPELTKAAQ